MSVSVSIHNKNNLGVGHPRCFKEAIKMTKVENIIRSFARQFNEFEPVWFQLLVERSSILLGEVTVEEASILYNNYGISSENDDDRIIYRVDNLEVFKNAIVALKI